MGDVIRPTEEEWMRRSNAVQERTRRTAPTARPGNQASDSECQDGLPDTADTETEGLRTQEVDPKQGSRSARKR